MNATVEHEERNFELIPKGYDHGEEKVVITGIHIPFTDLVGLMLKIGIAMVPVTVILALIGLATYVLMIAAMATN